VVAGTRAAVAACRPSRPRARPTPSPTCRAPSTVSRGPGARRRRRGTRTWRTRHFTVTVRARQADVNRLLVSPCSCRRRRLIVGGPASRRTHSCRPATWSRRRVTTIQTTRRPVQHQRHCPTYRHWRHLSYPLNTRHSMHPVTIYRLTHKVTDNISYTVIQLVQIFNLLLFTN